MIRYDLHCESAHRFEGWFTNSTGYDDQRAAKQIVCPHCGSTDIEKALMAPSVTKPSEAPAIGPREFFNQVRQVRQKILSETEDVGTAFPEQARQMHSGETEHKPIRGNATPEQVKELKEDGIPIAPVPPEPPSEN